MPDGACGPRQIRMIWNANNENILAIGGDVIQ